MIGNRFQVTQMAEVNRSRRAGENLLANQPNSDLENQLETDGQVNQVSRGVFGNEVVDQANSREESVCVNICVPCCFTCCGITIISALAIAIFSFSKPTYFFNPLIMPLN